MKMLSISRYPALLVFLCAIPAPSQAIEFDDPSSFELLQTWDGASLGVPGPLGGLMFSADGSVVHVIGDARKENSVAYSLSVQRDPHTGQVSGLAVQDELWFEGDSTRPGLAEGLALGPDDTLFYTYCDANHLGERPFAGLGEEGLFDLGVYGITTSASGLSFSPHLQDYQTGFGTMLLSVEASGELFIVALSALCDGLYLPLAAEVFATLPDRSPTGIGYVPRGHHALQLLVADRATGALSLIAIDPDSGYAVDAGSGVGVAGTGDPEVEVFAHDMDPGPAGIAFDPVTHELFVTVRDEDGGAILHIGGAGFENRAPVAEDADYVVPWDDGEVFVLGASDPDGDPLEYTLLSEPDHGQLDGEPPKLEYGPEWGFEGTVSFDFEVSDGELVSEPATITFEVIEAMGDDDDGPCCDDDTSDDDTEYDPPDGGGTYGQGFGGIDCECAQGRTSPTDLGGILVGALVTLGLRRRPRSCFSS